ncbi:MAG: 16S rRNA (cytosine(967)-C(5))-methyltransferase RsmB [Deltaproteobacteria bacterium]|nr:16S rRNA (cytosine(967)-C(5))-methyltransferase RsmB [Deltaproteobacteria bacterium]
MAPATRPPDPKWYGSARAIAIEVLRRVDADDAYADLALNAELSRSSLDARDRAFATDLVYGTLRWRGRLDYLLNERAERPIDALPPQARAALRAGAYQLLHSRSVPPRAAVGETVEAMRALGMERLTGFANALLRRLNRERDNLSFPDPDRDPVGHAAACHAHPPWIVERLFEQLGHEEAVRFMEADNVVPPLTLRVRGGRTTPGELIARLADAGFEARAGRYAPGAVVLVERAPPGALPGFAEGCFAVQDEASQLVSLLVGAARGERVLDLCAAPGGKTAHLAEQVGPKGRVVALDANAARLDLVTALCRRMGLDNVETVMGDARGLPQTVAGDGFDCVLADAPCTGLGVLRRNPDARWRMTPDAPARLAGLQSEILARARTLVRPGGVLVYSVCTFAPEETIGVIEGLLGETGDFVVESPEAVLGEDCREMMERASFGWALSTWPQRHGTDAFFAVRMRRRG